MRSLILPLVVLIPLGAFAETRAMDVATREGLVGTWEALVQDDSMATGVYQMVIPKEGDAHLIQLFASGTAGASSHFFGRATSFKLEDGNVTIRFTVAPEHIDYYDWVEVQGYAVAEGPIGAITGKIIKHRADPLHQWSEPVAFKKGRWIRDLERIAAEAARILRAPTFRDSHVVPKETSRSR